MNTVSVWHRECGGIYHMGPHVRPMCGKENIEEKDLRTKKGWFSASWSKANKINHLQILSQKLLNQNMNHPQIYA